MPRDAWVFVMCSCASWRLHRGRESTYAWFLHHITLTVHSRQKDPWTTANIPAFPIASLTLSNICSNEMIHSAFSVYQKLIIQSLSKQNISFKLIFVSFHCIWYKVNSTDRPCCQKKSHSSPGPHDVLAACFSTCSLAALWLCFRLSPVGLVNWHCNYTKQWATPDAAGCSTLTDIFCCKSMQNHNTMVYNCSHLIYQSWLSH